MKKELTKINKYIIGFAALSLGLFSCDKKDPEIMGNGPDLMEEAVVYAGPENNGIYNEAQTSITLEWKGHSLTPSTVYAYPPRIYVKNVTPGAEQQAAVYDVELTSVEGGGLNAAVFNFAESGITQVKNPETGEYEMVEGYFDIVVPMGIFESASVSFNPQQTISFTQMKDADGENRIDCGCRGNQTDCRCGNNCNCFICIPMN